MDKNPQDVITQASWILMQTSKDTATTAIVAACRAGDLKIENEQVQKLLLLVGASVEEGYNRGSKAFTRVVEQTLTAHAAHKEVSGTKKK